MLRSPPAAECVPRRAIARSPTGSPLTPQASCEPYASRRRCVERRDRGALAHLPRATGRRACPPGSPSFPRSRSPALRCLRSLASCVPHAGPKLADHLHELGWVEVELDAEVSRRRGLGASIGQIRGPYDRRDRDPTACDVHACPILRDRVDDTGKHSPRFAQTDGPRHAKNVQVVLYKSSAARSGTRDRGPTAARLS